MHKLKAGALQMTIFISVVIGLLLAAFIMFVHLHKRLDIQHGFIVEMVEDANRGIQYCLTNPMHTEDNISLDEDTLDYKSIELDRKYWGLFEKVISTAKIKQGQYQKIALIGGAQAEKDRTALYLEDNNNSLVLVGDTKIKGLSFLPRKGVKRGSILGKSYYGTELIYGPQKTSAELPKIESRISNNLKSLIELDDSFNTDIVLDVNTNRYHVNSFLEPTKWIYSQSEIDLNQISLSGNIIVKSRSKIIVDHTAQLKDVILIAPEIAIGKEVKGNFQAIASKFISVGENSNLAYPTALVLIEEQHTTQTDKPSNRPQIMIGRGSEVNGVVLFEGVPNKNRSRVNVDLNKGATISGELYCNQNLELRGHVYGSVFTNNFITKQSDYIFQNHIYNGQINIDKLPSQYVGIPFNKSKKGVLKWMY